MFKKWGLIFLLSTLSFNAYSSNSVVNKSELNINKEPPILQSLLKDDGGNYKFIRRLDMGKGMLAYLFIDSTKQPIVIYKTPNNRLVLGDLINIDGTNQNKHLMIQSGLMKSDLEKIKSLKDNATFISQYGKSNSINSESVFVFYDPYCPYCKQLGQSLKELDSQGVDLKKVHWIGVDFLGRGADSVLTALREDDANLTKLFSGGMPKSPPTSLVKKEIESNKNIANSFGINGVPAIIYMDNNKLKKVEGAPSSINSLKEIFEYKGD